LRIAMSVKRVMIHPGCQVGNSYTLSATVTQ
jgi:hypothetical protein